MKIDVERLKVDAKYWDEVAPDIWATDFCIDDKFFFSPIGYWSLATRQWRSFNNPATYELVKSQSFRTIPRPAKQSQEWENGLPPVGCECQARAFEDGKWEAVKVLAYPKDECQTYIVVQSLDGQDWWWRVIGEGFEARPLRTKEQREREELQEIIGRALMGEVQDSALPAAADAVLAWLKERPQ
jgi:hypothetical protein